MVSYAQKGSAFMNQVAKSIRLLRKEKGITQDDLAEKLHVTRQTVSNCETGKSMPDIELLAQIAEVLETDVNTLIYGSVKKEPADLCFSIKKTCKGIGTLMLLARCFLFTDSGNAAIRSSHILCSNQLGLLLLSPSRFSDLSGLVSCWNCRMFPSSNETHTQPLPTYPSFCRFPLVPESRTSYVLKFHWYHQLSFSHSLGMA